MKLTHPLWIYLSLLGLNWSWLKSHPPCWCHCHCESEPSGLAMYTQRVVTLPLFLHWRSWQQSPTQPPNTVTMTHSVTIKSGRTELRQGSCEVHPLSPGALYAVCVCVHSWKHHTILWENSCLSPILMTSFSFLVQPLLSSPRLSFSVNRYPSDWGVMTSEQPTNRTKTPTKHNIQKQLDWRTKDETRWNPSKSPQWNSWKPLTTPVSLPDVLPPAFFYKTRKEEKNKKQTDSY